MWLCSLHIRAFHEIANHAANAERNRVIPLFMLSRLFADAPSSQMNLRISNR